MPDSSWRNYEQVAEYLLDKFSSDYGFTRVEGKQHASGKSGTQWEIDAKAIRGENFFIVECKKWKNTIDQETVGGLAFRIDDTSADGGILVSPMDFQKGAKLVAASNNIMHAQLPTDSTIDNYLMKFMGEVKIGILEHCNVAVTDSLVIKKIDEDGKEEFITPT